MNDKTTSNEDRLGSIGDIGFAIREGKINGEIIIINSDNIFTFSLVPLIEQYKRKKCNMIALYDVKEMSEAKKMGVPRMDKDNKIIGYISEVIGLIVLVFGLVVELK